MLLLSIEWDGLACSVSPRISQRLTIVANASSVWVRRLRCCACWRVYHRVDLPQDWGQCCGVRGGVLPLPAHCVLLQFGGRNIVYLRIGDLPDSCTRQRALVLRIWPVRRNHHLLAVCSNGFWAHILEILHGLHRNYRRSLLCRVVLLPRGMFMLNERTLTCAGG